VTRGRWLPATALSLAAVLAVTGSIPRDAAAGIVPFLVPVPGDARLLPEAVGAAGDGGSWNDREPEASWRNRVLILLLILVILVVLVYRHLTGWKPTISG
jgi:hypothetical protein